jgi:hypothetical protein
VCGCYENQLGWCSGQAIPGRFRARREPQSSDCGLELIFWHRSVLVGVALANVLPIETIADSLSNSIKYFLKVFLKSSSRRKEALTLPVEAHKNRKI